MKKDDGSFEAIRYKQYIPGDPTAAYKWLLNRRRQDWTDKQVIDLNNRYEMMTDEEIDAAIKRHITR